MDLRYSDHARSQMARRRIKDAEVEEVLGDFSSSRYPSEDYPDERTVILGKTRSGRRLKVVVLTADPDYVVTIADRDNEE